MSQPSLSSGAGRGGPDFAHGIADSATASGSVECINFSIGENLYGVDIKAVREIKEWSNVTQAECIGGSLEGLLATA